MSHPGGRMQQAYKVDVRTGDRHSILTPVDHAIFIDHGFWFSKEGRLVNVVSVMLVFGISKEDVAILILKHGKINGGRYEGPMLHRLFGIGSQLDILGQL